MPTFAGDKIWPFLEFGAAFLYSRIGSCRNWLSFKILYSYNSFALFLQKTSEKSSSKSPSYLILKRKRIKMLRPLDEHLYCTTKELWSPVRKGIINNFIFYILNTAN